MISVRCPCGCLLANSRILRAHDSTSSRLRPSDAHYAASATAGIARRMGVRVFVAHRLPIVLHWSIVAISHLPAPTRRVGSSSRWL